MKTKFLPVFVSKTSNEIAGFLKVDPDTVLSEVAMILGIQKLPVLLRNGSTVFIGEFTTKNEAFIFKDLLLPVDRSGNRSYYCLIGTSPDDASIVKGAVDGVDAANIPDTGEWVETGFMGQFLLESRNSLTYRDHFIYL